MAVIGDIKWYRGDSFPLELTISINKLPVDITGYDFLMTVNSKKDPTGISTQLFQVAGVLNGDPATGKVVFTPTTIQTDITPGKHYYDIQMTDNEGHVRTIVKYSFTILQDITKIIVANQEYILSFEDADLVDNILTVPHDLDEMYPLVAMYDNLGQVVDVTPIPIDENNYTIDLGGLIEGVWLISTRVLIDRHTEAFVDADLVDNVLIVTHNLETPYPSVVVYNDMQEEVTATVISIGVGSFSVDTGAPITGTWHLTAI